jgi:hypothetical protein
MHTHAHTHTHTHTQGSGMGRSIDEHDMVIRYVSSWVGVCGFVGVCVCGFVGEVTMFVLWHRHGH